MARKTITNGQLSIVLQDISNIEVGSPALQILLESKIARFRHDNALRIGSLNEKIRGLGELYVKKDEKGDGMIEIKEGRAQLVFIDAEAETAYKAAYEEIMSKQIDIFT